MLEIMAASVAKPTDRRHSNSCWSPYSQFALTRRNIHAVRDGSSVKNTRRSKAAVDTTVPGGPPPAPC